VGAICAHIDLNKIGECCFASIVQSN